MVSNAEGAIVLAELDNTDVVPLAISLDTADLKDNIDDIAKETDLSPKHNERLKDQHIKQKKKRVGEVTSSQANSRQ